MPSQDLHDDLGRDGQDTYDFSNYTSALASFFSRAPGPRLRRQNARISPEWSLRGGNIANALLYNNNPASLIENIIGGTDNDVMTGNIADNHFTGGGGNDVFDGAPATTARSIRV